MKRFLCTLLSILLVCSLIPVVPLAASAASEPMILSEPYSPVFGEYAYASYSVTVFGENLRCTWFIEYGGQTYNVSDMTNASEPWEYYAGETYGPTSSPNGNVTTFTCFFAGIEQPLDGSNLYAVIEDGHFELTSKKAKILVSENAETPPTVSVPASFEVSVGDQLDIYCSAAAPDGEELSYLWYRTPDGDIQNGIAVDRGAQDTDTLSCDTSSPGTYYYFCSVDYRNEFGSGGAYSAIVEVTVLENQMTGDAPEILNENLDVAIEGTDYSFKIESSDENAQYDVYYNPGKGNDFEKTGLTLSGDGVISGTPTAPGKYTFTIMAYNDYGEDYQIYTLIVEDADNVYIEIIETPYNTEYMIGDTLDLTGLVVRVYVGETFFDLRNGEGVTTTASVLNTAGERRIKISYGDFFTFFYVLVEAPEELTLGILKTPYKTEYMIGDPIDLTGLVVRIYENGQYFDLLDGEGVTTTASVLNTAGERRIRISYGDVSDVFYVFVEAPQELTIELLETPDKTEYLVGETPDLTGLIVRVYQNGGYFDLANGEGITVSASVLNTAGERRIRISYGEAFTFFYVTVREAPLVDVDVRGAMKYVVEGRTVTVTEKTDCVVGYLKNGAYVAVEAINNGDETFSFVLPEGVNEAILAKRCDLNGDGGIDISDITSLLKFLAADASRQNEMASSLEVLSFLLNVDGDHADSVDISDVTELLKVLAGE